MVYAASSYSVFPTRLECLKFILSKDKQNNNDNNNEMKKEKKRKKDTAMLLMQVLDQVG